MDLQKVSAQLEASKTAPACGRHESVEQISANLPENLIMNAATAAQNLARPTPVIAEFESVFVGELRDLFFPIYFIYRPQALQLILVNSAVPQLAGFQF